MNLFIVFVMKSVAWFYLISRTNLCSNLLFYIIYIVAIIIPCLLGLGVATVLPTLLGLPKPERLTTAVECCYQNTGIATSAALSLFSGDELALAMRVPTIYGFTEAIAIGVYLLVMWKLGWTKAPKDEKICTVIVKSYELYGEHGEEVEEMDVDVNVENNDEELTVAKGSDLTTNLESNERQQSNTDEVERSENSHSTTQQTIIN